MLMARRCVALRGVLGARLEAAAPRKLGVIRSVVPTKPMSARWNSSAAATPAEESVQVRVEGGESATEAEEDVGMLPREVVGQLDRFIVGQADAKRAVAIALRNRWRRHRLPEDLRSEVVPKNILMIGPTGCGKTEIARRLAKLTEAPFLKVEATKFTEVGFHGRDVDQIIRDLVEVSINETRARLRKQMQVEVQKRVEDKILDILTGEGSSPSTRESFRSLLQQGMLDERSVELEVPDRRPGGLEPGNQQGVNEVVIKLDKMIGGQRLQKRRMTIAQCRPIIEEQEVEKLISPEAVVREAISAVEQDGIVFLDEIDKICSHSENRHGADASAEGVQRDLLPLIEGSTISTKHGNVNTDFILFVASGAFHSVKPSDLLAELQGRLPIRVNLKGLTKDDMYSILTEPETNLIRQQQALMETEKVDLQFTDEAIHEIASIAAEVNRTVENIGARRLHTIIEKIVEEVSFDAAEKAGTSVVITPEEVQRNVGELMKRADLSMYVL